MRRVLERAGYTVVAAPDAESALQALGKNGSVHLLLTDTIMPGMNGRELAEEVARRRPGLKVLMMSGYTEDETVLKYVEAGGAFLTKPFSPDELTGKVRETLDGD